MADDKRPPLKAKDNGAKDAKAKDAALQAAFTQIEREFGQGSLMRLGDSSAIEVDAIPTGALALDIALGVGGVPRGRGGGVGSNDGWGINVGPGATAQSGGLWA